MASDSRLPHDGLVGIKLEFLCLLSNFVLRWFVFYYEKEEATMAFL